MAPGFIKVPGRSMGKCAPDSPPRQSTPKSMSQAHGIRKWKGKGVIKTLHFNLFETAPSNEHTHVTLSREELPDHFVLFRMSTPEVSRIERARDLINRANTKITNVHEQLSLLALGALNIANTHQAFSTRAQTTNDIASAADIVARRLQDVASRLFAHQPAFGALYEATATLEHVLSATEGREIEGSALAASAAELTARVSRPEAAVEGLFEYKRQRISRNNLYLAHREVLQEIRARSKAIDLTHNVDDMQMDEEMQ